MVKMSVRPIEFQVSIPKTFEASKDQQNFLKRGDIDTQQKAIAANEETSKRMSSVNNTDETEKKGLRNDEEGKNKRGNQENQKEKNEDEKAADIKSFCFDPGKIDIKI